MEIQSAVEKILKISPSVRVVTVCDLRGKIVFSEHSKKVHILVSKKQSLASLKAAAHDWKQRKKLAKNAWIMQVWSWQNMERSKELSFQLERITSCM